MRRLPIGASLASVSVVALLASAQQQFPTPPTPQHPIFRAGSTLVAVDVYPTKDGRVVEGLKPSDFEVKEDGKPQQVEFFEFLKFETNPADSERNDPNSVADGERLAADPHHRAFVAYFDTYHLTTWGARQMRTPVVDFLDRTIGQTDYFAAMNPGVSAADLTFGQRTETIAAEVENYWPLAAVVDTRTAPISPREQFLQACYQNRSDRPEVNLILGEAYRRSRLDAVLESLVSLVAKLETVREERTNVLLFSDGWTLDAPNPNLEVALWHAPYTPEISGGQLAPNAQRPTTGAPRNGQACDAELGRLAELDFRDDFRRLTDDGLRRNVAFYPVEPAGLEVFGDDLLTNPKPWSTINNSLDSLISLAASTNGTPIVRTNNIGTPLRQLSTALSSYYLLGYYTTNATLDGKYRTIQVKVDVPGAKVTNRHGYVASPNPVVTTRTTESAPATPEKTALETLARLDTPEAVITATAVYAAEVVIVAEVGSAHASDVANGADLTVTLIRAPGAPSASVTARIDKGARSALVRVPVPSTPGPWQAHVDIGAPADGLSSSFSVPAPGSPTPLVSDPILYRATPSPRSPLWPSASHLFTRNDRLHLEWTTSGPLDSHVGRLLDSRGQPIAVGVSLTEPPNAPRPTLAGDVSLAPLGPGDYLIELVVVKDRTTERHLVAIRIGA